jgi:hypothetical protein
MSLLYNVVAKAMVSEQRTFSMRLAFVFSITLVLVACQPTKSPERLALEAEGEVKMAAYAEEHMKPLLPICIDAVVAAKLPSAATMAKFGYSPRKTIFVKPLGDSLVDRLNMSQVGFSASDGRCAMGGVAGAPRVAGDYASKFLIQRGYKLEGYSYSKANPRVPGYLFVKGASRVRMTGGIDPNGAGVYLVLERE